MRAFVVFGPGQAGVVDVDPPVPGPGDVVVDVARAGVCGTDVELYTGEMEYLRQGHAWFPIRLGHEWVGTVSVLGEAVDPSWLGRRVIGDTMLGCGSCRLCGTGFQHVCEAREEVGIRGGRAGALAEKLAVPASSLHILPDSVDDAMGALVEPGGNALRAVKASAAKTGDRVLVLGPGTIGLLVAMFVRRAGAEVHLMGRPGKSLDFAKTLDFDGVWTADDLPGLSYDAVIDASNSAALPAKAVEMVRPGGRVVYIGVSGTPSLVDTRSLVLKDIVATGILSASPGLSETIAAYASGEVDPRPLISAAVSLDDMAGVLAGHRPADAGPGPKIHVVPR